MRGHWRVIMPKSTFLRAQNAIAARWRSLAERRRLHLLELQRNGHWRRYYSEESLQAQIQDAEECAAMWAALMDDANTAPSTGPLLSDDQAAQPAAA
jgi:uncharacterized repeat protein (TIGR03809 family)